MIDLGRAISGPGAVPAARQDPVAGTVMLDPEKLPRVLPTGRLLASGKPERELRTDLRRIANVRNAVSVAGLWAAVGAVAVLALSLGPVGCVVAFVLMVPVLVRFAILMHEAAHKLLFSDQRTNDWVGKWLLAAPAFVPIDLYRRAHFAHHKEEFGPNEPDIAFYRGYPGSWSSLRRRLVRDAVGISGWKNLAPLLRATLTCRGRSVAVPIFAAQVVLWAGSWLATGRWWLYPLLWLGPWLTGWRIVNRLRSIAEHGGLGASKDRRLTTHNVRQSWLARFWIVPYHTGWHLAHHVDMGIPWRNLPRFHAELLQAGYVTDDFTYPGYLSLWRALCSSGPPLPARADAR